MAGHAHASGLLDRRDFLRAAGAAFIASLSAPAAAALERTDALYATSARDAAGRFIVATVTEAGTIVSREVMPGRAHGVAVSPLTGEAVFFARRPGTFAFAYDPAGRKPPETFATPAGRHFFGHGTFSPDGRMLYATENDFDAGRGVIGLYDATDGYRRIGEFSSYGVGPHDMTVTDSGRRLVVANGGIETHPDFGRAKLNLAGMEPSIAVIDTAGGALVERHGLPPSLSQLSIRHLAEDARGTIWFGGQYEGALTDRVPLVGSVRPGEALAFADIPEEALCRLSNYIGAVTVNRARNRLAVTSPKGGAGLVIDIATQHVVRTVELADVCGLTAAPALPRGDRHADDADPSAGDAKRSAGLADSAAVLRKDGILMSSYRGIFGRGRADVAWDQHIAPLTPPGA